VLPGLPTRSTIEWVNPEGAEAPEGAVGSATGTSAGGDPGAIEHTRIPEEYRDHVRAYFDE
jgi:hypothetical protein